MHEGHSFFSRERKRQAKARVFADHFFTPSERVESVVMLQIFTIFSCSNKFFKEQPRILDARRGRVESVWALQPSLRDNLLLDLSLLFLKGFMRSTNTSLRRNTFRLKKKNKLKIKFSVVMWIFSETKNNRYTFKLCCSWMYRKWNEIIKNKKIVKNIVLK